MKYKQIIMPILLAGMISGLVAPIVWPFVIRFIDGVWPTWSIYPTAALTVSLFTIIIAVPCNIVLGGVTMLVLEKYNLNTPVITGLSGLILALLMYFLLATGYNYPDLSRSWPLATFFAFIGTTCGAITSYLTNKVKIKRQKS